MRRVNESNLSGLGPVQLAGVGTLLKSWHFLALFMGTTVLDFRRKNLLVPVEFLSRQSTR
jgi:hypothetical protein